MEQPFEIFDFKDEAEWLNGRMNGIGGSDASAVIGMNPYKSNIDLFEEKIGRRFPEDISGKACVIYGKYAEEPIRELFKLDYPEYKVEHHEFRILRSIEHPFMQASLDGELTDQDINKALEDVKKSDGYLFGKNEPINNVVGGTGGNGGADIGGDDVSAIRAAMGLPEKK